MSAVEDIVSLDKFMDLEVDDDDIEELVEAHNTELTTEELPDLQRKQQQMAVEGLSWEEEEGREGITTSLIKEMLRKRGEMRNITLTKK